MMVKRISPFDTEIHLSKNDELMKVATWVASIASVLLIPAAVAARFRGVKLQHQYTLIYPTVTLP